MGEGSRIEMVLLADLKIGDYQVWSRMSDERFDSFVEDVKENGIRDLIHVDENYTILDGHHRFESAKIAGIAEVDVKIYYGLDEEGKQAIAHKNNTLTREISRDEKIAKAIELWKGGRSQRQIAEWLGVGQSTVCRWLNEFAGDPHESPAKTEGSDGKTYPTEKPMGSELSERRETVRQSLEQGKKPKEIAEDLGVSERTVYNDVKAIEKLEEIAKKERIRRDSEIKLNLIEYETRLMDGLAPDYKEDEPPTSDNNIVILARKKMQEANISALSCYEAIGETDEKVRKAYISQLKSIVDTSLITMGAYIENEDSKEMIMVCLEILKKINIKESELNE